MSKGKPLCIVIVRRSLWITRFLLAQIQNARSMKMQKESGLSAKDLLFKNGQGNPFQDYSVKHAVQNSLKALLWIPIGSTNPT